jgi:hypothetical protein
MKLFRQSEYHMEIINRQYLLFAGLYPQFPFYALTFGAMAVTAAVVADAHRTAFAASVHMPSQGGSPALLQMGEHFKDLFAR